MSVVNDEHAQEPGTSLPETIHEQISIFRSQASDEIHVHGASEKNGKHVFVVPNYKQKIKHQLHYVGVVNAWHAQELGTSLPEAT